MKKLVTILLGLITCGHVAAQNTSSHPVDFILDAGIDKVSMNNLGLNYWALSHYRKSVLPGISGQFDLTAAGRWDLNLHVSAANPFVIFDIEFGRRLTPPNRILTSYINLDFGDLDAIFYNLAPINYTLTPDQQGQKMQLRSDNRYFGITSRNYIDRLRIFVNKSHQASLRPGFFVKAGWLPFRQQWKYGYDKDDGVDGDGNPTSYFNGVKVYGIPNLDNFFVDAGIFIGISIR